MTFLSENRKKVLLRTLFLFLVVAVAGAAAHAENCFSATRLETNTSLKSFGLSYGEIRYFEVNVTEPGLLILEASTPSYVDAEPKLALFDKVCRPLRGDRAAFRTLRKFIGGAVLDVAFARTLRFGVAAQDPLAALGEVEITALFLSDADLCPLAERTAAEVETDPDLAKTAAEVETDPDLALLCGAKTAAEVETDPDLSPLCGAKTAAEVETDPDLSPLCGAKTAAEVETDPDLTPLCGAKTAAEVETDPDLVTVRTALLCATGSASGLACATPLGFGESVEAKVGSTFSFTVSVERTVVIEAEAGSAVVARLYDAYGHRLAASGATDAPRLVRTLAPGTYFVKIVGTPRAGGSLTLRAQALDW